MNKPLSIFRRQILAPAASNRFTEEFLPFAKRIAYCGMFNSLSQTLLKIASPGVPDIYQGTELWDLSFVDPDNRRPVDYAERRHLLEELKGAEVKDRPGLLRDLMSRWEDGRIKLYLTHKPLDFRRAHQELFTDGEYLPLRPQGSRAPRPLVRLRPHLRSDRGGGRCRAWLAGLTRITGSPPREPGFGVRPR